MEGESLAILASLVFGGAAAMLGWWLYAALNTAQLQQEGAEWRYDVSRINELRRQDLLFRALQPVIQLLARINRGAFADRLPEIQRQILAAGLPRAWLAEEYLGRMQLIGLLLLPVYLYGATIWFGATGLLLGPLLSGATIWLLRRRLRQTAHRRLVLIKRRMPFFLDLLTLLIEAGSSFLQALEQAVLEFRGHPVSTEFGRVLADMQMGKTRGEAFDNLRTRLNDDEISNIVGSILQSEELGTPISDIFRTQADVLRVKRSQRAETIANEAGVNMLLPGVLVMAAAVLVILGPFMLNYFGLGLGI